MTKLIRAAILLAILGSASFAAAKPAPTGHKPIYRKVLTHQVPAKKPAVAKASLHKPAITRKATVPDRTHRQFIQSLVQKLAGLKKLWPKAMDAIKTAYRPKEKELGIASYAQLVAKTRRTVDDNGELLQDAELVPLPEHPERYHVHLRLQGPGRIGEADKVKDHDLAYYRYTRKYVAGALIELGNRLQQGALDIAGLTRTYEFQGWLIHKLGAKAAQTDFPSHALAIAFDVGLINTEPADTDEIIRRTSEMRAEGKILVNPEAFDSKCLHVVPAPEYQEYFERVYAKALANN